MKIEVTEWFIKQMESLKNKMLLSNVLMRIEDFTFEKVVEKKKHKSLFKTRVVEKEVIYLTSLKLLGFNDSLQCWGYYDGDGLK